MTMKTEQEIRGRLTELTELADKCSYLTREYLLNGVAALRWVLEPHEEAEE